MKSTSFRRSIDPDSAPKDHHHVDSFSEPQVPTCQGLEDSRFLNQPEENDGGLDDHLHSFSEPQTSTFRTPKANKLSSQSKKGNSSPSISEEWEKLIIIDDLDDDFTTAAPPRLTANKPPRTKPPSPVKLLDEKTSRILEGWRPPGRRSRGQLMLARPAPKRHRHPVVLSVHRTGRCCCQSMSMSRASR